MHKTSPSPWTLCVIVLSSVRQESIFPLFPMLSFHRLRRKSRLLHSLTGLTLLDCTELIGRLEPLWDQAEKRRLSRVHRERAIGAGHPYRLTALEDKLLLLLIGWRHALTHEMLGCLFGLDQSNVTRLISRLTPLMERAADPLMGRYLKEASKRRKKIGSLEEFFNVVPELRELLTDCTEQQRSRPKKKGKNKSHYSGYKHRHTLKTEITITPLGRILHVSDTYPGSTQDRDVYKAESMVSLIPEETKQFLDLGYEGLKNTFPHHDLRIPYKRHTLGVGKKGPAPPLTRGQKQANTLRRKRRLPVEHAFARMKTFRILSGVWRSSSETYNDTFRSIAALCNFRLETAVR